jgi:hypothetical protein
MRDAMRADHDEGTVTKMIEEQTARLPSGTYLTLGIGAMLFSWLLLAGGRRNLANFVGQWVPTILIMGLYNKLVKLEGSD